MAETARNSDAGADDGGFFRALVDGLPEAIIVSTPDGEIVYVNPALEELLGYSSSDLAGKAISTLVPRQPGQRAEPMKWLTRWAAEPQAEQSRFLDLTGVTKDGRSMPVDVRVSETRIDGERRFLISVRDHSVQREEMARNKENHLLMSRILAVAADAIISVDDAQRITFFNLTAERMFGYGAEEVVGQPLEMLMPERFRKKHHLEVSAFANLKQPSRYMNERGEVAGLRKDGTEFPVEATITKVSVGGRGTFTAHIRDITERKAHDEMLEESQRRFAAIFDHAFEAIGLLDREGRVLEINRAGRALTQDGDGLQGRHLWDLPWIGREDAVDDTGRQQLRDAVARAAKGEAVRYTVDIDRPAGKLQIDLSLTPVRDASGDVVYIVPEGRDITTALS
ncbi:MAG: PAS domain S-box protein [Parvibaculaceae bacterium]